MKIFRFQLTVAVLVFVLWLAPGIGISQPTDPKFSSCLDGCFGVCNAGPASLAWGCREDCAGKCMASGGPVPMPYGAIAVGTNGASGISWNTGNWPAANQKAITPCSRYANDCKVVYRFQNSCAALAQTEDKAHFDTGTGSSEEDAKANAIAACGQHWGSCSSVLSACSFASTVQQDQGQDRDQPESPPEPNATSWGAIAYSASDMKVGTASGKSDRSLAEQEAMSVCSQQGNACVLQATFNKQCGALTQDRSVVGSATSANPQEARQKAIDACTKNGGAHCALHVFFCSLN